MSSTAYKDLDERWRAVNTRNWIEAGVDPDTIAEYIVQLEMRLERMGDFSHFVGDEEE